MQKSGADAGMLEILGRAQLALGQPDLAIPTFRMLVQLQRDMPEARQYLADAYESAGLIDGALAETEQALWLSNNAPAIKFQYARLQTRAGRTDIASEMLAELRKTHPDDPGLLDLEGAIALAARRPRDAVAPYQRLFADHPASINLLKLARAKQEAGLESDAVRDVEAWLQKNPKDLLAQVMLGDLFVSSRQFEKAVPIYLEAVRQVPNNVAVLNNLAWSLAKTGRPADGVEHARKAASLAPDSASVLDTYGVVLTEIRTIQGGGRNPAGRRAAGAARPRYPVPPRPGHGQGRRRDDGAGHPQADPGRPRPDHGAGGGRTPAQGTRWLTAGPAVRPKPVNSRTAEARPLFIRLLYVKVIYRNLRRGGGAPGPLALHLNGPGTLELPRNTELRWKRAGRAPATDSRNIVGFDFCGSPPEQHGLPGARPHDMRGVLTK